MRRRAEDGARELRTVLVKARPREVSHGCKNSNATRNDAVLLGLGSVRGLHEPKCHGAEHCPAKRRDGMVRASVRRRRQGLRATGREGREAGSAPLSRWGERGGGEEEEQEEEGRRGVHPVQWQPLVSASGPVFVV